LIYLLTALDWGIIAFTLAVGMWGYRQGLIVGFLTLIGFATGAFIGSRLAPLVLNDGDSSPYAPLLAALGALIVGALVAVALESIALGLRARLIRGRRHLHLADGAGGAALVACVALGIVWVFGAVALHAPGTAHLRGDVQRSLIMRSLNELLPPSGPVLNALDRVDPAPSIVGPVTQVAPPDRRVLSDPEVKASEGSVVRILGTACGLGIEGSGWAAGPGLIVTNAHVIAGEEDTTVTTSDGTSFDQARRARRGARISRQRPLRGGRCPLRRNPRRGQPGLLRERAGAALDQLAARHRAQRQLGGAADRRRRAGDRHRLRDHDDRQAWRFRDPGRDRRSGTRRDFRRRRHGPLHRLTA
jgi:hypothetical protein